MTLIKGLLRRPLIAIATVLAFLVSAGIAVWYSSAPPAKASAEDKQHLQINCAKASAAKFDSRPGLSMQMMRSRQQPTLLAGAPV